MMLPPVLYDFSFKGRESPPTPAMEKPVFSGQFNRRAINTVGAEADISHQGDKGQLFLLD